MNPLVLLIAVAILGAACVVGRREARLAAIGKATALTVYLVIGEQIGGPVSPGALFVAGALGVYWLLLVARSGAPWLIVLLMSQGLQLLVQGCPLMGWLTVGQALAGVLIVMVIQVVAIACAAALEGSGRYRPRYVSLLGAGQH